VEKNFFTFRDYKKVDSGEYRIVYRVSDEEKTIYVILIEKRNDDEVYKILKNL
jgi:mRNA interferase RelE/StbE